MVKKYTVNAAGEKRARAKPMRHMEKKARLPDPKTCSSSVEMTLAVIGGKWKSPILWHLFFQAEGPMRFTELKKAIPAITQRMLARQLRELEADGILFRDVYPVVPPHVEYGVTEAGRTLIPVLRAMCKWGRERGWSQEKGC